MADKKSAVVLPVLQDRAKQAQFVEHTQKLTLALLRTLDEYMQAVGALPMSERPSGHAVGAACYAVMRHATLQFDESDPRRDAIREGFLATFQQNDDELKRVLFLQQHPPKGSA